VWRRGSSVLSLARCGPASARIFSNYLRLEGKNLSVGWVNRNPYPMSIRVAERLDAREVLEAPVALRSAVKNGAVPLTPRLAIEPIRIRRMASKGAACDKNRFFPRRTKTINAP
jgi:hypothetical protein